jgi:hypothetical protein
MTTPRFVIGLPAFLRIDLHFRRARHKTAIIVAAIYLSAVLASFCDAAVAHDPSGLAFLPFVGLTLPWSFLVEVLSDEIPMHGHAWVVCVSLCFLFSGVNALVLYWLVVGISRLGARMLGRGSG